ncbi:MAG: pantetheine-phosphate adenylyltransferase [Muribaculaceae bacterium]|nr:pantetheine-phosphate adenylyltransferase [Muribaculaceae bacterium]MDE5660630.1 pantetheine-phosphate adenylyltransferase [Muribaculaceae bacterium]MDE6165883.1 pantetheine-phosphate adenylyltransferase [Muribaculaceae bacterium]MDE6366734.1 pantetheine-phosphate adenylyltransferase [Muribaculaceae bacterium]
MKIERIAFFAGSFDPFTVGHESVVMRGLTLFDRIVIGIGINADKPQTSDIDDRVAGILEVFGDDPRIEVEPYSDLTWEAARRLGCTHLLRGARTVADFEYERTMADANRNLSGLETVILFTLPEHSFVSSSLIRDLQRHGADVTEFLP